MATRPRKAKAARTRRPGFQILVATTSQTYPIVAGTKATGSAALSAQAAQKLINSPFGGTPIDIAASTLTLEEEGTTKYAEWNVFVLVKR